MDPTLQISFLYFVLLMEVQIVVFERTCLCNQCQGFFCGKEKSLIFCSFFRLFDAPLFCKEEKLRIIFPQLHGKPCSEGGGRNCFLGAAPQSDASDSR